MKKVTILLSVFALVAGLSQCRKPSFSALNGGETQHVVLSANNGNDGSKVSVSLGKTMDLKWEENDKIKVSCGLNGTLTLVSGDGGPTATFEGYATRGTGGVVFTYGGTPVYTGQTGTQEFVKEKICLEGTSEYKDNGNYDVLMKVPYAVLKLDLSKFADTKTDEGVTVTIEGGAEEVTVIGVTAGSKELYVAMPADVSEKTYTFSGNGKVATVKNWPLKTNTFYTGNSETGAAIVIVPEAPVSPELLPGKFSVSADKYVQFAKGNLFCTDKGSNNYEFSFEQNQYDYRCRNGKTNDKAVINGAETATPSFTSGLFQWIPRTSSSAAKDWGAFSGYSSPLSGGQTSDVLDFGDVFPASDWTTLTGTEWQYLLEHHTKKIVTVNGVLGLCIAPDAYIGDIADSYTVEQWSVAEGNGMVFLPYYGYYNPGVGNVVVTEAAYWSSTASTSVPGVPTPENCAQALKFHDNSSKSISINVEGRWRTYGQNVRLVQRFNKPHDAVKIGNLYWATENLAVTASGKKEWKGQNSSHPTGHIVGDYFQYAASYDGYNLVGEDAKIENLVIYSSFTHQCCGDANYSITMRGSMQFNKSSSPYYNGSTFTKYSSSALTTLESTDDVANIVLGGNWRMPTKEEYEEMIGLTEWTWVNEDKGYYVTEKGVTLSADKSNALLFFPASGFVLDKNMQQSNSNAYGRSSTVYKVEQCYRMQCNNSSADVEINENGYRLHGFPIRPVHD